MSAHRGFAALVLAAALIQPALAADIPMPQGNAVPQGGPQSPVGAISGAPVKYHFALSKFVATPGPLVLRDSFNETRIPLPLSARIRPTNLQLTLVLSNSIALVAARSVLTVRVNDATLAQIRLDPASPNAAIKVNIPADLLRAGYNTLAFSVTQHNGEDCEDPEAPELWTEINTAESAIDLTADYRTGPFQLSDFGDFLAPGIGGIRDLAIVAPGADTLAAGVLVAEAAALRAQYEPVIVRKEDAVGDAWVLGDHALVGTKDSLAALIGKDEADKINGPYLAFSALDKRQARLIVSGKTAAEVTTAARALADMDIAMIGGDSTTIREIKDARASQGGHVLQPDRVYAFSDLGLPTTTVRGAGVTNLDLNLPMAPDLYAPEQANVDLLLDLNYGAGFGPSSVLNVEVNGKFVRGIDLVNENGGDFRNYRIPVPLRDFVGGANRITFAVYMRAQRKDKCAGVSGRYLAATVFGTSSVRLPPAARMTLQPDLDLFGRTGFPYAAAATPGEIWVSHPELIGAAWTVAGRIAQAAGRALPDAAFRVGGEAPKGPSLQIAETKALSPKLYAATLQEIAEQKRVPYGVFKTIASSTPPTIVEEMLGITPSTSTATVAPADGYVAQTGNLGRNAVMTAVRAESGAAATTTVITADTPVVLAAAVERLVQPEYWSRADGDLMLWRDTPDSVATFRFSPRFAVGEDRNTILSLRLYVSQHPWWWLAGTAAVLMMLSGLTVWILTRRKRGQ